jgi:hypothetical protein
VWLCDFVANHRAVLGFSVSKDTDALVSRGRLGRTSVVWTSIRCRTSTRDATYRCFSSTRQARFKSVHDIVQGQQIEREISGFNSCYRMRADRAARVE